MISFLAYSKSEKELSLLKNLTVDVSSMITEEDLKIYGFASKENFEQFLKTCPVIDISCVDICENGGVQRAERIRSTNSDMTIMLIVDATLSPASYIIPSITAGSLLIRPFDKATARSVLDTVMRNYCKRFDSVDKGKNFVIDTRDGRQIVPYSGIIYFESRDKKIFLGINGIEYSFYDTLDRLEESLDGSFIRCHRSFIIAKKRIKKVALSKNLVILDNGMEIPLSRSYKAAVREAMQ